MGKLPYEADLVCTPQHAGHNVFDRHPKNELGKGITKGGAQYSHSSSQLLMA